MSKSSDGFQVYTRRNLALYDWIVLGFSNRFLWRCPSSHLLENYRKNVSKRHLEIGVGTGYFLEQFTKELDGESGFRSSEFELHLADPNAECLRYAESRLGEIKTRSFEVDLLEPDSFGKLNRAQYGSVGLNYVIHCLPGGLEKSSLYFEAISAQLGPDGILFGSTILPSNAGLFASRLMNFYNGKKIFSNLNDTRQQLQSSLENHFHDVQIEEIGCVALFRAAKMPES